MPRSRTRPVVALAAALAAVLVGRGVPALAADAGPPGPVVVELFTSEGCSSCPPADAALAKLETDHFVAGAEVIALEEHVDYWNHLGWSDPFSSKAFSRRQQAYAAAFGTSQVYTPQMVVNGRTELVGSDETRARAAIASAARGAASAVHVEANVGSTDVATVLVVTDLPAEQPAEIWVAITEGGLSTDVPRGENGGRTLRHAAVVRVLERARPRGTDKATVDIPLDRSWKRESLRIVAFVQDWRSRAILGAAAVALPRS